MDGQSILEIVLRARDEASKKIKEVGDAVDAASKKTADMSTAFKAAGGILVGVGVAGAGALFQLADAAAAHQKVLAQTDAVLKSTKAAFDTTNMTVATHSVTVGLSTKQHAALQKQLDAANYSLLIATDRWDATKKHTKAATDEFQHVKDKVATLQEELGKTTTVLVGGKGLAPAVQITKEAVLKLSEALGEQTTYSDNAVLSAENLLLTFTSIGKDIFPQTTRTILDVATAMHEDLQSAAIQVGKALQDPASGMAQLHRIGVNFTKSQIDAAKAMEASGNLAGAQAMILKELQTEFGGSAKAAGQTFSGAMQILNNQFEKFKETLGARLIPDLSKFVGAITTVIDKLNNLSPATYDTIVRVLEFGTAFALIVGPILLVIGFLPSLAAGFVIFSAIALPLVAILAGVALGGYLIYKNWGTISPVLNQVVKDFSQFWAIVEPQILAFITNVIKNVQNFVKQNQDTFNNFFTVVKGIFIFSLGFIEGFWSTTWKSMLAVLQGIWQMITGVFQIGFGILQVFLAVGMGLFTGNWIKAWQEVRKGFNNIWTGIQNEFQGSMKIMLDGIISFANSFIGVINGIIKGANSVGKSIPGGKSIPTIAAIPKYQDGGYVPNTGLAMLHAGEFVLSKDMLGGNQSIPSQVNNDNSRNSQVTVNANIYSEMDVNLLGNKLAFAVRNAR